MVVLGVSVVIKYFYRQRRVWAINVNHKFFVPDRVQRIGNVSGPASVSGNLESAVEKAFSHEMMAL